MNLQSGPISGEIVTIWVACSSDDARGNETPMAYYLQESAARALAKGAGWYGADGSVLSIAALKVDGKYYLLETKTTKVVDPAETKHLKELKSAAKAKLTPAELKALLEDDEDES